VELAILTTSSSLQSELTSVERYLSTSLSHTARLWSRCTLLPIAGHTDPLIHQRTASSRTPILRPLGHEPKNRLRVDRQRKPWANDMKAFARAIQGVAGKPAVAECPVDVNRESERIPHCLPRGGFNRLCVIFLTES